MTKDTKEKLSPLTITLHWIVGLTIIGLLALGIYMSQASDYGFYPLHKSIGITIFLIIITRVIWRLINGWPEPVSQYQKIEHMLARIIHYILLIGSVLIPLSGMIMSIMGGHGAAIFGLEIAARNFDPLDPSKAIPHNAELAKLGSFLHEWVSYVVIGALVLHVAGALKHHFISKDATLRRMLGGKVS
ncbi:MAG: cytochrome b [Alphaproteobacteria bacterium]|nr:cytochrome b [Alphaproteobacteria bacterium]